jgi:Ca-activated chloride channel family protein
MNLEDFHFIRPIWSLAIVPLLIMLWLLLRRHLNSGNWATVCDPQLLPHILLESKGKRRTWPIYTFGIASLLSILALAGPTWEHLPQPAFRDQSALVILLDLSHSMDATDIKPSRLVRANFKVADILKQRQEGQTALIVYAGEAFTITPLTDDTDTIASQLSVLTTSLMPVQGSRTDIALEKAMALLQQAGLTNGNVLLITDGVNEKQTRHAFAKLNEQGHKLSILGVGTEEGAPIPQTKGGFLKDAKGAIVIPKLEEAILREFANRNGGIYQHIKANDSDILAILAAFESDIFKNQADKNNLQLDTWREQGPWLLLLVLPLAALAFRRGYLALILLFFLPMPKPVQAYDWDSLWLTPDQRASQAYAKEDMQQAAKLFKNPQWKAATQYKTGQYEEALKSLEGLEGADNLYNKGNALAKLGRFEEAIAAYKKALELEPKHEDAIYNKELVEKQLEKNKQDSQNQDSQNQDSENQDSQNQDSENQDSQNQNAQSQDSQKQNSTNQEQQENESANSQASPEKSDSQESSNNEASMPQKAEPSKNEEQQAEPTQNYAETTPDEMQQAREQLLRKIPDDPGGLLRRKFRYQYQQQRRRHSEEEQLW